MYSFSRFYPSETSQAEPEEVPEEEGVANRSEVKEETEEPEMKVRFHTIAKIGGHKIAVNYATQ